MSSSACISNFNQSQRINRIIIFYCQSKLMYLDPTQSTFDEDPSYVIPSKKPILPSSAKPTKADFYNLIRKKQESGNPEDIKPVRKLRLDEDTDLISQLLGHTDLKGTQERQQRPKTQASPINNVKIKKTILNDQEKPSKKVSALLMQPSELSHQTPKPQTKAQPSLFPDRQSVKTGSQKLKERNPKQVKRTLKLDEDTGLFEQLLARFSLNDAEQQPSKTQANPKDFTTVKAQQVNDCLNSKQEEDSLVEDEDSVVEDENSHLDKGKQQEQQEWEQDQSQQVQQQEEQEQELQQVDQNLSLSPKERVDCGVGRSILKSIGNSELDFLIYSEKYVVTKQYFPVGDRSHLYSILRNITRLVQQTNPTEISDCYEQNKVLISLAQTLKSKFNLSTIAELQKIYSAYSCSKYIYVDIRRWLFGFTRSLVDIIRKAHKDVATIKAAPKPSLPPKPKIEKKTLKPTSAVKKESLTSLGAYDNSVNQKSEEITSIRSRFGGQSEQTLAVDQLLKRLQKLKIKKNSDQSDSDSDSDDGEWIVER